MLSTKIQLAHKVQRECKVHFVLLYVTVGSHLVCWCGVRCSGVSLSLAEWGIISCGCHRTVTKLAGRCGFAGRGASEVSGRRLCQVPGGWAGRSTVRSTGSSRPGTDRAQRRTWCWAAVDLDLPSKVWSVHF